MCCAHTDWTEMESLVDIEGYGKDRFEVSSIRTGIPRHRRPIELISQWKRSLHVHTDVWMNPGPESTTMHAKIATQEQHVFIL